MENSSSFKVEPRLAGEGVVEICVSGKFNGSDSQKYRVKKILGYEICKVAKIIRLKFACDDLHQFISGHVTDKVVEKIAA